MSDLLFLATEKVTAETLFEGFSMDLQATADLLKNLSNYNPSVWNYVTAITRQVTTPVGIAIMTVLLLLELSNLTRKLATIDGRATLEHFAPLIIKLAFVVLFLPNSMKIIETILSVGIHVLTGISSIVSKGSMNYDTFSGFKGHGIAGKMIIAFFSIIVFLCRLISVVIIHVLITMRFMQLYLMIPFSPLATATLIHEEWRSVGIGFYKNVMVYSIQGVLIFLVVSFVSLFQNEANKASGVGLLVALVGAIVQAILLIIVLVGTQRTARNIMGM